MFCCNLFTDKFDLIGCMKQSMMMSGIKEWAVTPEIPSGSSCPELSHRFPEERETLSLDDGFDQTPVLKRK